ncbi:response regulator [Paenibacillus sp. LMG 31459]|uniref:Response regulator n=1 Tax=Paenibacillus phytohabitans TaxID=2654978 RepID=A0ABX1YSZ8_9BACL|nr:response regulator transcription factor [Paenibacillus phytohabitans]NOU83699.1 response regulator [Paenibacillus phytohabitans]
MEHILIVEDEKEINGLLRCFISEHGYLTTSAYNGLEALQLIQRGSYDLILLDLMLPYKSGDQLLCELREHSEVPVIVISAKDTTQTKIELLRIGADDYITKPFDLDETLARIESNLRRNKMNQDTAGNRCLTYQDIQLDEMKHNVEVKGRELALTAKEYGILELLMKHPEKIYSKANLFKSIWNEEYMSEDNTLNVHISNIRNKLKAASPDKLYIETVWGIGYRLYKTDQNR